jgi:hypothetical protein
VRRIALVLLMLAAVARADVLTVADVQVLDLGPDAQMLRVRASGPQPFDVVDASARRLAVRLHGARLGALAPLGDVPFGRVRLVETRNGGVLLRIDLDPGWQARVTQGPSPNAVDVRLTR